MSAADQSDDERRQQYERVKRNGQPLTALINDLLDMSKAEAGRLDVEMIDFDFIQLVNDVEQTFRPRAAEKSIDLSFDIDTSIPRALRSDPTRVQQILINLLSNALKFTHDGGQVRVSLTTKRQGAETTLLIRVSDSGRGMSEEEQGRLFQPFAQADVSMTRKFGGTGLGLFVSRRLARALGGDLTIESSKLGQGTTFLACIDMTQKPKSSSHSITPAATSKKDALDGVRVLLVDDSPDNRELISIFLEAAGASV
jgi:signal transduction histidine kinase